MTKLRVKKLFIKLALFAHRKSEDVQKKKKILREIGMELKVAEDVLDDLAKKKTADISLLMSMNKKIGSFKETIRKMKKAS